MLKGARLVLLAIAAAAISTQPLRAEGLRKNEGSESAAGFNSAGLARVDSMIEAAIRGEASPGAALAIGRHGEMVRMRGYGRLSWDSHDAAVNDSSIYDIASLTKVVGTTSAIMILVERGQLDLDTPIHFYLPAWPADGDHGRITLRHLLTHTSGLPAGADLWTTEGHKQKIERIALMRLTNAPGLVTTYSDLGMIVVAEIIETVTNEPLDDFLYREVFEPLGMRDTRFNRRQLPEAFPHATPLISLPVLSAFFEPFTILASWAPPTPESEKQVDPSRIAPTEHGVPRGYVHDGNAAAFDGVAGHAGLFSSLRDLAVFASSMLEALHGNDLPIVTAATVNLFMTPAAGSERTLGWDLARGDRSSSGDYFSASSVGHTGFTGTSIWIDPERDLFVVLLTNRVHPSAANQKHVALRREVHDAVQLAIEDEIVVMRAE